MYKSRLQQLCHQRQWALPSYEVTRDGPDHGPLFRATTTVHDQKFSSPDEGAPSIKEASNLAAKAAFEHLTLLQGALPVGDLPPPSRKRTAVDPLAPAGGPSAVEVAAIAACKEAAPSHEEVPPFIKELLIEMRNGLYSMKTGNNQPSSTTSEAIVDMISKKDVAIVDLKARIGALETQRKLLVFFFILALGFIKYYL